jgi:hypothetical protein
VSVGFLAVRVAQSRQPVNQDDIQLDVDQAFNGIPTLFQLHIDPVFNCISVPFSTVYQRFSTVYRCSQQTCF